jgi:hypothetical protein
MKNIHVIPTDKPSRLVKQKHDTLDRLCLADIATKRAEYKRFKIYITNDEEIKEGDWLIVNDEDVMQMKSSYDNDMTGEDIWVGDSLNGYATYKDNCKKIILTTDKDLIKDGVQAIDDEFLEWFVNNPSCESVETIYGLFNPMGRQVDPNNLGQNHSQCIWKHKIIIPQEEPKQEIEKQIALNEMLGRKIVKYLDKYKGQNVYNEILLAVQFGYHLKLEEDE